MDRGKDDIIVVKAEDISDTGDGIGKAGGFTWFVKGAVPGDVVEARVTKVKKTYGYAEAIRLLEPSPCRIRPRCPYFSACGGCQLQDMEYDAQLKFKENLIKNQLSRIGGIADPGSVVRPVLGMPNPWRYRDNEQFYPGLDEYGRPAFGFYAGRTHEIIKIDDCQVGIEENPAILDCIINHMEEYHIRPYDEDTGGGVIGRVQIRKGFATGEIMVCIDVHDLVSGLKAADVLTQRLYKLFPASENRPRDAAHIKSICARVINDSPGGKNTGSGSRSEGNDNAETVNLYGPGIITDRIGDLEFQISPLSFYQVNPIQTKHLYDTVLGLAGLCGTETVWDLYCGTGTISLFLAEKARQVYGVETVSQAVEDARRNAEANGIGNVRFFAGKAEEVLPRQYEKEHIRADVIVVDPPRKGCARACLDTMIKMQPARIVYVSCDTATLARDIKILSEGGYELRLVQPIDVFAQSVHIEAAALLERQAGT